VTFRVKVDSSLDQVSTSDIIVDYPAMNFTASPIPNSTIVIGSHLDSVPQGPGINDNGSGSSMNLALATLLADNAVATSVTFRFAWWGGEEEGLLGSDRYAHVLNSSHHVDAVLFNLNFDMVASPNYAMMVYNGSDPSAPAGSDRIADLFVSKLKRRNLPYSFTEFDGRSDYGPFLDLGIPAGGLFTGAEEIKTVEDRDKFGGLANAAYDPCYHQFCCVRSA
jgi:Zn-dependent M28 family amino/carboxypeptidase